VRAPTPAQDENLSRIHTTVKEEIDHLMKCTLGATCPFGKCAQNRRALLHYLQCGARGCVVCDKVNTEKNKAIAKLRKAATAKEAAAS